jgi:hypothetical protein
MELNLVELELVADEFGSVERDVAALENRLRQVAAVEDGTFEAEPVPSPTLAGPVIAQMVSNLPDDWRIADRGRTRLGRFSR